VEAVVLETVDARSARARAALAAYFAELAEGFAVGDAFAEAATMFNPPQGSFVVAMTAARCIGCGGLSHLDDHTVEIKRMWVSPRARGVGLGKRLLAHLEGLARQAGASRVVLDTNAVLVEAIAMYRDCGYEEVERYNDNLYAHHWFAKRLGAPGEGPARGVDSGRPARRPGGPYDRPDGTLRGLRDARHPG
jgi:GNAT superfamily N-acetyltransferase